MYSFHKQDKIFASDLYGRLQWLAYRLAIVKAHTDLPLIFYLLLNHQGPVVQKPINANPRFKINQGVYFSIPKCCSTLIFGKTLH